MPIMHNMSSTPDERRFWSAKEAAAYVQVTVHCLYAWVRENGDNKCYSRLIGPPPPVRRFGRNVLRFPVEEFKAWANNFDSPSKGK